MRKAYYEVHENAYQRLKEKGLVGWGGAKRLDELGDSKTKEYLHDVVRRFFSDRHGRTALDVGCGTGTTAFELVKMGFAVTGVDISRTAIEMAHQFSRDLELPAEFITGDVLSLELPQKFDLIYDSHCLHCIVLTEDRQRAFKSLLSHLKSGGLFVLDTMVFTEGLNLTEDLSSLKFDHDFILWHKTTQTDGSGLHLDNSGQMWQAQRRIYPARIILEEVENAGFKIVESRLDSQGHPHPDMLRLVLSS